MQCFQILGQIYTIPYLQSLRVSRYVSGHIAQSLSVTVHCRTGAGALGRAWLTVCSAGQDQNSHQQHQHSHRGAVRANGAPSSHHHCGKWGPIWDPQKHRENRRALKDKAPKSPEGAHQTLHATGCRPPFSCPPLAHACFRNVCFWIYIWVLWEGFQCVRTVIRDLGPPG